ncbi:hypothetical protein WSK_0958 [Novosphingobium sp. Rr 2-17]|nr:hypothetical protein WSK_0958 [Novosphingobium sp. Rr 2-17]
MDHRPNPEFLDDISGALDWWRTAGVDCDFLDEPATWLAPPEVELAPGEPRPRPQPRKVEAAAPERPRIDPATLPADLPAFKEWWMTEPLLTEGGAGLRVPPRGVKGAKVMVLVEEPESEDGDVLLAGSQGRLLSAMLTAFGIAADHAYVASALPRHTPGADWTEMTERGLGAVLTQHIALVAPQRLFVLGSNVLSLLGHEPPQGPAVLRTFNHEGAKIPMIASWALRALASQPRAKAALWRAWLEGIAV